MSLIGEALKKAHLEAVRQDGSSAGLAHTPGVAHYRQRHASGRTGWSTALVISNVVLALIVVSVVIWQWNARTAQDPVPTIAAQSSGGPVAAVTPPLPVAETKNATVTELPAADVPRVVVPEPRPAAVEERTSRPEPVAVPATPPPVKPAPAPSPRSVDGLVAGQTYMRTIPVPGGNDLVLNGMSVSGGVGVALINSRMVRKGDRIGPFTVGSIGDRRVELSYKGITVYLKMP